MGYGSSEGLRRLQRRQSTPQRRRAPELIRFGLYPMRSIQDYCATTEGNSLQNEEGNLLRFRTGPNGTARWMGDANPGFRPRCGLHLELFSRSPCREPPAVGQPRFAHGVRGFPRSQKRDLGHSPSPVYLSQPCLWLSARNESTRWSAAPS